MIFPEKIAHLKRSGLHAVRLAMLWEEKISVSGIKSAEDLYLSLGHNHIEKKSYDYEGLTLSREPKDHEKLCVKGIAIAQEAGKASVATVLLNLRSELIDEAMSAIKRLSPAEYHTLILSVPDNLRTELRDHLGRIFQKGRKLVADELRKTKADDEEGDDPAELDDLTDLTDSRVVNDVQTRISAAAARYALLGLSGAALWRAVRDEMNVGSVSYIEDAARGAANKLLALGREAEMRDRADSIERYEFSALLDNMSCNNCPPYDGQEAVSLDDLPEVPLAECEGGLNCRCFIVAISI